MGPEGVGAAAWILWLREETGSFEKISYGGRVLRTAEREALLMGIDRLTVLFPAKVSLFDLKVGDSGRTVLFGLHSET